MSDRTAREWLDDARHTAASLHILRSDVDVRAVTMYAVMAIAEHLLAPTQATDPDDEDEYQAPPREVVTEVGDRPFSPSRAPVGTWSGPGSPRELQAMTEAIVTTRRRLLEAMNLPTGTSEPDATRGKRLQDLAETVRADVTEARGLLRDALGEKYAPSMSVAWHVEQLMRDAISRVSAASAEARAARRDARERSAALLVTREAAHPVGDEEDMETSSIVERRVKEIGQWRERFRDAESRAQTEARVAEAYRAVLRARIGSEAAAEIDAAIVREHVPRT